jgi:putative spermidine/putrescine transport system substrate-binding protein
MDRRSLLKLGLGQAGLAICGMGLTGCQSAPNAPQILGLKGAIPPQVVKTFRQRSDRNSVATQLVYQSRAQLQELFTQLQNWKRQTTGLMEPSKPWITLPNFGPKPLSAEHLPDLVSLGDYWLSVAIVQGLIQPFDLKALPSFNTIDDRWKQIVTRNAQGELATSGQIWGVPYRWGGTVIGYRRDLLAQQGLPSPKDWGDLLNPAFKGRISLLDSPRETIGLALKHLGQSYNSPNLATIANLETTLRQFHQQTKFYSSDTYLQPLILGHTWIAVGSSSELLPQLRTQPDLEIVVPESGTALWADVWTRPQGRNQAQPSNSTPDNFYIQWLEFCLNRETSQQIARLSRAGSPLAQRTITSGDQENNPLLNLPEAIWQKSETLQPLTAATVEQYRSLWQTIRR